VSVPLFIFLIGGIQVAKILLKKELIGGLAATLIILAGVAIGWLWWSVAIVKWKLWAYRLIDDHEALEAQATKSGLTWTKGHFLERTEWWSKKDREQFEALKEK
jgi:hypothetical protein